MSPPSPPSAPDLSIDTARGDDRDEIRVLLEEVGLDVPARFDEDRSSFRVLRADDRIGGVVALSAFGPVALLHSLAVHPEVQGRGYAQSLILDVEAHGRAQGVRAVYLFTDAEAGFFRCFGYRAIDPEAVPPDVARTPTVQDTDEGATCMWKQLGTSGFA